MRRRPGLCWHHHGLTLAAPGSNKAPAVYHDDVTPDQLGAVVRTHRLRRASARLVLSRNDYRLVTTEMPEVPSGDLTEAMRWHVADMVDFDVSDAVVETCFMGDNKRHDGRQFYFAVLAKRDNVQAAIHTARRAGLRVQTVTIPEMALRNLAARLPEADQGVVALYAEPHSATIILMRGDRLYVARQVELSLGEEDGSGAEELVLELQRALDYFDGHFDQPPVRSLAVLGDEPVSEEAVQYLGGNLRLEARWIPLTTFDASAPEAGPGCAFALGAALGMPSAQTPEGR